MQLRDKLYIGGRWVPSASAEFLDVHSASTEQVIARVPAGSPADIQQAVSAARAALDQWANTAPAQRAACLSRIHAGLKERADEIARTISLEVGTPLKMASRIQAGLPQSSFALYAQLAGEFPFEEQVGNSLVVRDPVGVVAAITPWNYPLHQIAAKVAPALAAGCTIVLKPSEVAPLNAFILAEIIDAAGLPPRGSSTWCRGADRRLGKRWSSTPKWT
jgi:acyl-CoA reductase-like NAD-dependent aldehyde dehydrogenase